MKRVNFLRMKWAFMFLAGILCSAVMAQTADTGVTVLDRESTFPGFTLYSPTNSTSSYLIDMRGNVTKTWESEYTPGASQYLMSDGHLIRTGSINTNPVFDSGGKGGVIQEFDWEGNVIWEFEYSSLDHLSHHDIEVMPSGHILMIAWEYKNADEAVQAGRNSDLLKDGELWPDHIIEIAPDGESGGEIVWEWHVWDHLIQDLDSDMDNYGVVSEHPELVDINVSSNNGSADWNHTNAIDYNARLDQILISVRNFSEIWIIDHSTTTEEAASHTGGTQGKGGDLLFRWGNPQVYGRGDASDQTLFVQHNAQWISNNLPGGGNILVFNNGQGRPDGDYSSVDELSNPASINGEYTLNEQGVYGPETPIWSYTADPVSDFYSSFISGAQRLPNGNTLICEGVNGRVFEVTEDFQTVWEFLEENTSQIFRATRYGRHYSGLSELDFTLTSQ